jgi:hypothetical protein
MQGVADLWQERIAIRPHAKVCACVGAEHLPPVVAGNGQNARHVRPDASTRLPGDQSSYAQSPYETHAYDSLYTHAYTCISWVAAQVVFLSVD